MRYVEISNTARHGKDAVLFFIPVSEIQNYTGFRTLSQFDENDVIAATTAGTISVLCDTSVYIDTLCVDFDNSAENADTFRDWLIAENYHYELHHSGSRSQHFHVAIEPLQSRSAPKSLKEFMVNTFGEGFCDQSLYSYTSLFRLSDTVHEKTGVNKTLLESQGFYRIKIDLVDKQLFGEVDLDISVLEYTMIRYMSLLGNVPSNGNRSQVLWSMSKSFAESSISYNTAEELMMALNDSWGREGKEVTKVRSQLNYAYK